MDDQGVLWDVDLEPQETPIERGFEAGWTGQPCPESSDKRERVYLRRGWKRGREAIARYWEMRALKERGVA